MSEVQHLAAAFLPVAGFAGTNVCEHFAASAGTDRILVVVWRSHCECRLAVLCERHVAFDDAGAHAGGRDVGFAGVFGKFQRRTAVADGKIGLAEGAGALGKLCLQRTVFHLVHQVKRPRPDLRLARQGDILRGGGRHRG